MPDVLKEGFVRMTHPDGSGETTDVTVDSYVETWRDKGWQLVEGDVPEPNTPESSSDPQRAPSTTEAPALGDADSVTPETQTTDAAATTGRRKGGSS